MTKDERLELLRERHQLRQKVEVHTIMPVEIYLSHYIPIREVSREEVEEMYPSKRDAATDME